MPGAPQCQGRASGPPHGECLACYLCVKYLISSPKFILTTGGGGATTTGPDATPPPSYLSKLAGGGAGGQLEGGRLEGVGGGVEDLGGGGSAVGGGGRPCFTTATSSFPKPALDTHPPWRYACGCSGSRVAPPTLQMGRSVHSGCGDLSLCNKRHLLSASSC